MAFRVTGDDGHQYFSYVKSQEDLAGDFEFEISPNSAHSNPSVQQQVADEVLQLTSNPLDIQLGIITPSQRYEALKNALSARGVKDFGRFIQKPPQHLRNLTPEEEANRILAGIDVPVTPEMAHEDFMAWFDYAVNTDEVLGWFSVEQTMALQAQYIKHQQMLEAMKAMAAQQANAAQMQRNASMSQQQAPAGLNPAAGGGPADAPAPQQ
jgi:hypothetical protein